MATATLPTTQADCCILTLRMLFEQDPKYSPNYRQDCRERRKRSKAFVDILASEETFGAPMEETYGLLGLDASQTTTLEAYLGEYFTSILKKLKEVGATSRQTDFYV
eukprot:jgi/Botrbrau1/11217/Bobra.0075s0013.1